MLLKRSLLTGVVEVAVRDEQQRLSLCLMSLVMQYALQLVPGTRSKHRRCVLSWHSEGAKSHRLPLI